MSGSHDQRTIVAPWWIRRPESLHVIAYGLAALVFVGQLAVVVARGVDGPSLTAVLLGGAGALLSWRLPWVGLVVTGAASFAVSGGGDHSRISVWMLAVLVLFSFTLRRRQPLIATAVVAALLLSALMTADGFAGGPVAGVAALFSAVGGGATGAGLRIYRENWFVLAERAEAAMATREAEATRRVGEERLRIARDLHDVIGHQVAMLSVHLGVAEIGLPENAEASREALAAARASGRTVVQETQRILTLLRRGGDPQDAEARRPVPSLDGLEALVASFAGIGLDVEASIDVPDGRVEPGVGVTVYRVVQEGLTNAHRHGGGVARVDVLLRGDRISVLVENARVRSSSGGPAGGGLGLVGMRERVESSGGRLTIEGDDGVFRVRADLDPRGVAGS